MTSTVTVSLEPHLARSLEPLTILLQSDLSDALANELRNAEINYSVLTQISRWARSGDGRSKLRSAGLNPRNYDNIVSLLAGTRTSPFSKPPPSVPLGSGAMERRLRRELNDRKALIAVVNGLLSVGCTGATVWWAADKSGWRDEWKVLTALLAATVVGVSEIGLFVIWHSRLTSSIGTGASRRRAMLEHNAQLTDKKSDDNGREVVPPRSIHNVQLDVPNSDRLLRHRTTRVLDE